MILKSPNPPIYLVVCRRSYGIHDLWCYIVCSVVGEGASGSMDSPRPPRSGATLAPTFTSAFTNRVVFVNTVGAMLPCTAAGRPAPTVKWIWADSGQPVVAVPGLVEPFGNGSLRFMAFADAAYNEAVHSAASLRCQATNDVGTVVSKLVRVRAGQFCNVPCYRQGKQLSLSTYALYISHCNRSTFHFTSRRYARAFLDATAILFIRHTCALWFFERTVSNLTLTLSIG